MSSPVGAADEWSLEYLREGAPQRRVDFLHGRGDTELRERSHAVLGDPARNDAAIMLEFRVNIERDTMVRDPPAHAHADRGNLFLIPRGPHDPDADAAVAPFSVHSEARDGLDYPFLELVHVAAHILPAAAQIQHDIGDPLAGPVIGITAPPSGAMNRQALRLEQLLVARAGPGGEERWMLEQPDQFAGRSGADRGDAPLHFLDRSGIIHRCFADPPLDPGRLRYDLSVHVA